MPCDGIQTYVLYGRTKYRISAGNAGNDTNEVFLRDTEKLCDAAVSLANGTSYADTLSREIPALGGEEVVEAQHELL